MRALSLSVLLLALAGPLAAQEICNNGIDDDGDGQVDLNDSECLCGGTWNDQLTSLVANRSFEERQCCPYGFVTPVSPPWMACATGWHTPTMGTTDYMHTCGYMPGAVVPLPLPDGGGCLGGSGFDGYDEYIGQDLTGGVLHAGVSYTLSLWMASSSLSGAEVDGEMRSAGAYYEGPWRVTLYGSGDALVLPLETLGCVEGMPGWMELATIELVPVQAWQPVTIQFVPPIDISSFILGPGCIQPSDIMETTVQVNGQDVSVSPYLLYDDLILNTSDQFVQGIVRTGAWCTEDLVLSAYDPGGALDGQWYRDGIALAGQTGGTLALSVLQADGGLYSYTCMTLDGCIRSDIQVPFRPTFTAVPDTGMAPLEVTFITATPGNGPSHWDFGDGAQAVGDTVVHVYWNAGDFTVSLQQEVDGCSITTVVDHAVIVQQIEITAEPQPTDINETHITLTGNGPEGITSWVWDLGAVPPFSAEGQQVEVDFPSVAGVYEVMLVVSGEFREPDSDTAYYSVVILPAVGIDGPTGNGTITVKPNPVEDVVTVQMAMPVQRWWVVNALGEEVLRGTTGTRTVQFGTTSLGAGTYVLMMQGADAPAAVRFIKR